MSYRLYNYCLRLQSELEDTRRYMDRHLTSARTRLDPSENIELMAESYKHWYVHERAQALTLIALLPVDNYWQDTRAKLTALVRRCDALYIRFWEGR